MGVVVPPLPYYLGLKQWDVAEAIKGEWDCVLYEIKKFVRLLMKQNPNVIELLWVKDEDILSRSVEGMILRENRDLFRHERYARDAFIGYAMGQLKKTEAFDKQTMEHIDYLEQMLKDAGIDPQHVIAEPPIQVPDRWSLVAGEYRHMRDKYRKSYMGAKRWDMVRKIGWDTKNGGHLVRLLHVGYEYLTTGQVNVRRTWDRDMLMEIKRGEWELARVKEHADLWFEKLKTVKSVLPDHIDESQAEGVVMSIIQSRLS